MSRGDYDQADGVSDAPGAEPSRDVLYLSDRQLCERIAAERYAAGDDRGGLAFAELAARIQRVLAGEFAAFTRADLRVIEDEHLATLRRRVVALDESAAIAKARSRGLSRLGVLVLNATRGNLEQLRGPRRS